MVGQPAAHLGFALRTSDVRNGVFVPRYYSPELRVRLAELRSSHELVSLEDMRRQGWLHIEAGHEIGKMAYGTGDIPFVRTSDIVNWELKADPKQGVSDEVYAQYCARQNLKAGDILFVRDGTYLIGQTCLVTDHDLPCLYQSHILRFRVESTCPFAPPLLLACFNAPTIKRQIRAKQFTADIIDTIGNRYLELVIPIPKDAQLRARLTQEVASNIAMRVARDITKICG